MAAIYYVSDSFKLAFERREEEKRELA